MKNKICFIILLGLFLASCGGEVEDTPAPTPVPAPTPDPPENYTPAEPFARVEACASDITVTPARMRRLSHKEYDNAVRDLLNTSATLAKSFPNDLPAAGFASNRGDPLAELGAEKLMLAAEQHAEEAVSRLRLDALLPCRANRRNRECAIQYITDLGRRAFRRTLTQEEASSLADLYDWGAAEGGFTYGIRAVIEQVLQSPNFLYHPELTNRTVGTAKLTGRSIAERLAAMLWQSIPDETLLLAAENGSLDTPEGILTQAKRMLSHTKGRDGIVEFFNQWLDIEKLEITEKDATRFPAFTPELRAVMWEETTTFVDYVVRDGDGKLSTLLTSNLALPKGPLAEFYGVRESTQLTAIDATTRAGLLTHPSFLAVHAHGDQTSPVKRGVFIRDRIMCSPSPEAPASVNTTPPDVDPMATTRERFSQHRDSPVCAACHDLIDPLGFAFEHFDAMGHYRMMEGELSIDASGEIRSTLDMDGFFDGANELNQIFVQSKQVQNCMATQWLRYATRQRETPQDACSLQQAQKAFAQDGNLQDLIFAVVQSDAFRYKSTGESK